MLNCRARAAGAASTGANFNKEISSKPHKRSEKKNSVPGQNTRDAEKGCFVERSGVRRERSGIAVCEMVCSVLVLLVLVVLVRSGLPVLAVLMLVLVLVLMLAVLFVLAVLVLTVLVLLN